jgi:Ca-activated chloride channel family protein
VIQVELRYTELLVPREGVYEFVYPTVVGPRYSDRLAGSSGAGDAWVENPYLKKGTVDPASFDLGLTLAAGLPIEDAICRTHSAHIVYANAREARLTLDAAEANGGNRDFVLRYRLAGGAIQTGLLLAEGPENFFLLMVQPPARPAVAEMPPRDFVFIVDVSGSMNGFPLNTAKKLIKDLLQTLRPQDAFNLLLFAGDSEVLAPASVAATPENIASALRLLERQNGRGATQLLAALKKAFALPQAENVSRTIAVVTDGYIDVEAEAFQLVRAQLARGNLFAFGIGAAVNRHLIEGLARAGRGEPFIVTSIEDAAPAAVKFREYISSPVLARVAVAFDGMETYDVEPAAVPDVFARRPVVLFGKWRGSRTGRIRVTGLTGAQPYEAELDVAGATVLPSADGLSRLWARARIADLDDLIRVERSDERVAQVTHLGLTYNLLTRYTSFVAVDDQVRRITPTLQTVKQPLPLPQGVENSAVGNPIATSPEPETLGLMLVAASALAFLLARQIGRSPAK